MSIPIYQVDAFTDQPFAGNPAAVCVLENWLEDRVLQQIGTENNLSETAFIVANGSGYDLRWFTPNIEVDLCGHATLASAFVVFEFLQPQADSVRFATASGELTVSRGEQGRLVMDFPATEGSEIACTDLIERALGARPREVYLSRDLLAVFDNEQQVRALEPDFGLIQQIPDALGVIASAPGEQVDFVSRFFAPAAGVAEDPVTGSAHCTSVPFWAKRLDKAALHARQISRRGGELLCEYRGERVLISGECVLFLRGEISCYPEH